MNVRLKRGCNTGTTPLKLYTIYAPPIHRDGVIHHTRDDAEADSEHFDGGQTTDEEANMEEAPHV